ncbi:DUF2852 domain-containing protein [Sagittula sp. NFXS13]|uniref:DUF2852 domain-containing protein n=1 Tax=Sagittula sp. NFXS13 TaxID=2819095 RepID=UPI0032DE6A20
MTTAAYQSTLPANAGWLTRTEAWLDHKGKAAWIAAMVLGFIIFWPVGAALLAYMIWSKRMFGKGCNRTARTPSRHTAWSAMKPSGNSAFDAYKADTLQRLQNEQEAFEAFLERLREAKDKTEFDQFMEDREKRAAEMAKDTEAA